MDTALSLFVQSIGLDAYGLQPAAQALRTLLRVIDHLPTKSYCVIGGMVVIHHVGKDQRHISPDLDLLVHHDVLHQIAKLMPVQSNLFGFSIACGSTRIDCIRTDNPPAASHTVHVTCCKYLWNLDPCRNMAWTNGDEAKDRS
jgi:hypothetical protein